MPTRARHHRSVSRLAFAVCLLPPLNPFSILFNLHLLRTPGQPVHCLPSRVTHTTHTERTWPHLYALFEPYSISLITCSNKTRPSPQLSMRAYNRRSVDNQSFSCYDPSLMTPETELHLLRLMCTRYPTTTTTTTHLSFMCDNSKIRDSNVKPKFSTMNMDTGELSKLITVLGLFICYLYL